MACSPSPPACSSGQNSAKDIGVSDTEAIHLDNEGLDWEFKDVLSGKAAQLPDLGTTLKHNSARLPHVADLQAPSSSADNSSLSFTSQSHDQLSS